MTLSLTALLAEIGDDNIEFQNLDTCADALDWSARAGLKVTFGSDQTLASMGTEKLGLVVWLPRNKVKAILDREKTK